MRVDIVHPGAGELQYEIRGIVNFATKLQNAGMDIIWENIGDPIAKGEEVPEWIREIVARASRDSLSYAYSPTKGLAKTRSFLSGMRSNNNGTVLNPDDIVFFNGLGDAITKTYTWLNPIARVLGPSPAYPTHSSVEGAHGRSRHLTYNLDPNNDWLPDIEDIRNKIKYNPNIAALLIINPDNPTGVVYPRDTLEKFVALAKEFDLFLVADEIYANLAFESENFVSLAELSDGVPTIVMRGLSKEVPWPGSRCGWLEFYNTDADNSFKTYARSLEEAKMIEVCSTTLPQLVLPDILGDSRYNEHVRARVEQYKQRATTATELLNSVPAFRVVEPKGAFYLSVAFTDKILATPAHEFKNLQTPNLAAQQLLDEALADIPKTEVDKRFCYVMLAHTGICTVPLSTGFNSHVPGFRMTLLESNDAIFNQTLQRINDFAGSLLK